MGKTAALLNKYNQLVSEFDNGETKLFRFTFFVDNNQQIKGYHAVIDGAIVTEIEKPTSKKTICLVMYEKQSAICISSFYHVSVQTEFIDCNKLICYTTDVLATDKEMAFDKAKAVMVEYICSLKQNLINMSLSNILETPFIKCRACGARKDTLQQHCSRCGQ